MKPTFTNIPIKLVPLMQCLGIVIVYTKQKKKNTVYMCRQFRVAGFMGIATCTRIPVESFFFIGIIGGDVQMGPLGTSATNWLPYCTCPS
jgi:hypothetical protein